LHLGSLAKRDPSVIGALGFVFCAIQIARLVICLMYLFTPPIVFEGAIAVVLALAAWRVRVVA
jgi:hypothetical protein